MSNARKLEDIIDLMIDEKNNPSSSAILYPVNTQEPIKAILYGQIRVLSEWKAYKEFKCSQIDVAFRIGEYGLRILQLAMALRGDPKGYAPNMNELFSPNYREACEQMSDDLFKHMQTLGLELIVNGGNEIRLLDQPIDLKLDITGIRVPYLVNGQQLAHVRVERF